MTDTFDEMRAVTAPPTLLPGVLTALDLADQYVSIEAPIGPVYVAFNSSGVSAVTQAPDAPAFERSFETQFGRRVFPAQSQERLVEDLQGALAGRRTSLTFDLRGLSPFERDVLMKALEIPRGEVRPYAWIAREIGRPRAVRAVGTALAHNPIPLFIPCHRVVRSDGVIGNYGLGGPANKRALLTWEGVDLAAVERRGRSRAGTLPLGLE
jgi:methylated-DNA-[protein]-cysteine S-methyltransferase